METSGTTDGAVPTFEEKLIMAGSGVAMTPYCEEDVKQSMINQQPTDDNGDLSKTEKWIKTAGAFGTFIGFVSSMNFIE